MSEIEPRPRTAEELNQDLKLLLGRFPARANSQGSFGGFLDLMSAPQPHDETLQQQLRDELDSFLDKTMLRPATRKLLQRPIQIALDQGLDHKNIEKEHLYKLLDLDSKTGGLFNPFNIRDATREIIRDRTAVILEAHLTTGGQLPFDFELSEAKKDYFDQWEDEV